MEEIKDNVNSKVEETVEAVEAVEAVKEVEPVEEVKEVEEVAEVTETTEEEKPKVPQELLDKAKWYVLHTFSSYENVAQDNLERVVEKFNLQERIFDIVIPMEEVIEEKNGKKKLVQRKVMPSYLLVKMIYGDDIWHAVTRTRGITGFVGPKGRPLPLTEEEIMKMRLEKVEVDITLSAGDKIEVLDGPLDGMIGTVLTVDSNTQKCRVNVEMFGRETPVDLGLDQVRKI